MRALIIAALALLPLAAHAETDAFGRTVTCTGTDGVVCSVPGGLSVQASSVAAAISAFNGMAPAGWVFPTPPALTTISASAFLNRFTAVEQAAVQQAAAAAPTTLGVGLTTGLAAGVIDLTSAVLKAWMDGLVTAGALTAARETAILTP